MICYGNQFYNLPPPLPPCTFTLTTVYKINCCTLLFNMSYSRIALTKLYSYKIKRNEKLYCTNNKNSKALNLNTWWLFPSG